MSTSTKIELLMRLEQKDSASVNLLERNRFLNIVQARYLVVNLRNEIHKTLETERPENEFELYAENTFQ